jgi:hypothetical protein
MKALHSTNFNKPLIAKICKAIRLSMGHSETHHINVTNRKGENIIRVKKVKVGSRTMFQLLDKTNHNLAFELSKAAGGLKMFNLSYFFQRYLACEGEIKEDRPYLKLDNYLK